MKIVSVILSLLMCALSAYAQPTATANIVPLMINKTTGAVISPTTFVGGGSVSAAANFGTDGLVILSDGTLKGIRSSATVPAVTITNLTLGSITGVVGRANGGTGLSAAGASGNVLTSNGTNWLSSAPSGGGGAMLPGTYFRWTTADLANKPANSLVADGTNGTATLTPASGLTDLVQGNGTVAAPTFSPVAGSYTSTQTVTITPGTSGASSYYTTNGTPPTTASTLYTVPVSIATTSTIKVLPWKSLYTPGAVANSAYTITLSSLLSDDMEYATGGAATTAGWVTATGTPTWAYATAPAPLLGSYSLRLAAGDEVGHAFTASSDCWFFAAVNYSSFASRQYTFSIRDGAAANVMQLQIDTDGSLRFMHGTYLIPVGSAGSMVTGATYYIWMHYASGTGANGLAQVYVSTNQIIPGSPIGSITTGTATTAATTYANYSAVGNVIVDKVRVSSVSIGSNPP